MATQSTPELLPVIQADRTAMFGYYVRKGMDPLVADSVVARREDADDLLQLIARQRIEHSTPDRNAVLEEAIQAVRGRLAELTGDRRCDDEYRYELNTAISRIRALTTTPEPTEDENDGIPGLDYHNPDDDDPTDPAGVSELTADWHFRAGAVDLEEGDQHWHADIDTLHHGAVIQCWGTEDNAVALRDHVLAALQTINEGEVR